MTESNMAVTKIVETDEEKRARRKKERKERISAKRLKRSNSGDGSANVLLLSKKVRKTFGKVWETEMKFVNEIVQVLPEFKRLPADEDGAEEDYLLDDDNKEQEDKKREKFLQKLKEGKTEGSTRAVSHEELRARLHAKLANLHSEPNLLKREKKKKRKEKKRLAKEIEGTENKKKKFISKANPNLANQQKGSQPTGDGSVVKSEAEQAGNENSVTSAASEKTPLRKKPVVKSNGEVVYSKFDFISGDKRPLNGMSEPGTKPKPEKLLKKVQKAETTIARLATEGKSNEAASLVETQKWDSALKRAQGEKIRDDPTLLKKTIKKMDKRKQVSKKKWQERTEKVEKLKESKQEKRQSNIQTRKDEKKKKVLKQQRKKGRIV